MPVFAYHFIESSVPGRPQRSFYVVEKVGFNEVFSLSTKTSHTHIHRLYICVLKMTGRISI